MKQNRNVFRTILSMMLIALTLILSAAPALAASKGDILVVNTDFARLRAKPVSGSDVLTKLRKGQRVTFLKDYRGWLKIELGNGKTGYMYKDFLNAHVSAKVGNLYKSRSSSLPVRSKPSKKGKVKFSVSKSPTMVLLERHGSWGLIRVVSNGKVGYVNLKYLRSAKK